MIATDVTTWSTDMRYRLNERIAIKMDSHIPEKQATEQAREEVWATRETEDAT